MAIQVITPPAALPITLDEAKAYTRVVGVDDDDVIEGLIAAARDHIEQATARIMVATTFQLTLDEFPPAAIMLPRSPVLAVNSIIYDGVSGTAQTLDPASYFVDDQSEPGWIVPLANLNWPATLKAINSVRVEFVAGYAPGSPPPGHAVNVPERAKLAVKTLTAHWYDEREPGSGGAYVTEIPYHLTRLVNGLRVWR